MLTPDGDVCADAHTGTTTTPWKVWEDVGEPISVPYDRRNASSVMVRLRLSAVVGKSTAVLSETHLWLHDVLEHIELQYATPGVRRGSPVDVLWAVHPPGDPKGVVSKIVASAWSSTGAQALAFASPSTSSAVASRPPKPNLPQGFLWVAPIRGACWCAPSPCVHGVTPPPSSLVPQVWAWRRAGVAAGTTSGTMCGTSSTH